MKRVIRFLQVYWRIDFKEVTEQCSYIMEKIKDPVKFPSIATERSFITDKSKDTPEEIQEFQNLIQLQMKTLPEDLNNVLKKHENDYLNAFKYQIFNIKSQINQLKKAADSTGMNLKHNDDIKSIQKSIEWYTQESKRLKVLSEEYKTELDLLKSKNKELKTDRKYFKSKLKSTKRKIKFQSIEEQTENKLNNTVDSVHSINPIYTPISQSGRNIEELLLKYKKTDARLFRELEELMERKEQHFEEATRHYKSIISNEKRKLQNFSVMKNSVFSEKNDIENLFLDCVEEVRREIAHRKVQSMKAQKFSIKSKILPTSKNEVFSSADKRKILELLISNEKVLMILYEKLFPNRVQTDSQLVE